MQEKRSEWLSSFNSRSQGEVKQFFKTENQFKKTTTISITGGKGGVGKTSISLKFSRELANLGHRVLLIDCDYNLSNTAIKLGLPVTNTFYSLVSGQKDFSECLYKENKFHLLSACNGSVDLFDSHFKLEDFIIDIIATHGSSYDFILLDCPAGLTKESLTLSAYCDERFFVVTPDKASITDSYSLVKVLSEKHAIKENHLIVNMFDSNAQYERVVKTLSETIENFLQARTHLLGGIRKIDITQSRFDHFFLNEEENSVHENFLKIIKKYTDLKSRSLSGPSLLPSFDGHLMEQEVH